MGELRMVAKKITDPAKRDGYKTLDRHHSGREGEAGVRMEAVVHASDEEAESTVELG